MKLRAICKCGGTEGRIETRGGQDCVFCSCCNKYQYNAPKTETGRKARSVATTHEAIKPKQSARIKLRANGHCELCGARPTADHPLHVSHLLSVEDGFRLGLTDQEINSDENLAAWCDECNLGLGSETIPLRLAIAIVMARTRSKNGHDSQVPEHSEIAHQPGSVGTLENGQPQGRRPADETAVSDQRGNGGVE